MKKFLIPFSLILAVFLCSCTVFSGFLDESRNWQFIQDTGGMRIENPVREGDKLLLPVEYSITGLREVTCEPRMMNSGLVIRKIKVTRKGDNLILLVISGIPDDVHKNSGPMSYVDISSVPEGTYKVFYQNENYSDRYLGSITIEKSK